MATGIDPKRPAATGGPVAVKAPPARPRVAAWRRAALLFVAAASATASGQTFRLTDYSGEELYQRFCSACHGPSAQGDGPVADSLNVLVPDLTRLAQRRDGRFPAAEIREIVDGRSFVVAHGTRTMPVWGYEFWVEEGADAPAERDARELIDRLIRYLESIQVRDDPTLPRD